MPKKIIRILFLVITAMCFAVFFIPLPLYGVFNLGNIAGMMLFGAVFLCLLFSERFCCFVKKTAEKKTGKALIAVFCALAAAALTVAAFTGAKIVKGAANEPPEGAETTAVVLGCRVYDSGASRMLLSRIAAARDYLEKHPESVCILSGGQGDDEPMAEAKCMFEELTSLGISPDRLIMEDMSESTRENISFSLEIIKEKGLPEELTLITNEYHQYRASIIAEELGCKAYSCSAESQIILLPTYFVREIFGIIYETVRAAYE